MTRILGTFKLIFRTRSTDNVEDADGTVVCYIL